MSEVSQSEEGKGEYSCVIGWPHPEAKEVFLSGSFNNWAEKMCLQKSGQSDLFSIRIDQLQPGIYTYKFMVDNGWKYDPETAFVPDEYGNFNNFIRILPASDPSIPQMPIKTMIRAESIPVLNPLAAEESLKIKSLLSSANNTNLNSIKKPNEITDEYQYVDVSEQIIRNRSESETSLASNDSHQYQLQKNNSVLLTARTQHFGGDLVTQEHNTREMHGGHRSLVSSKSSIDDYDDESTQIKQSVSSQSTKKKKKNKKQDAGKLILFLVGLPGRGKTFIGHILARYLTWMGHSCGTFNVGEYRRRVVGQQDHDFWDPSNEKNYQKRTEIAMKALDDALCALENDQYNCVIFDATNSTFERRNRLKCEVRKRGNFRMLFVESIYNGVELIANAINEMKLNSADYENKTLEEAAEDYFRRIEHYADIYQPMEEKENLSFLKIIDVGRQIFCNEIHGYLQSRILFLMANLQIQPRPIWLSRHGQSEYNTQSKIGGDSALSPLGQQYAHQLTLFINQIYKNDSGDQNNGSNKSDLNIWTSTMLRTGMTVAELENDYDIVKWKQLDEIDAGICDGMTYKEVASEMPEEYANRAKNKLHYRYPRGESYQDVIHRLEPVITEISRTSQPLLIVAHQAILRVLYAYLTNRSPEECPTINIPLHVVIQLTPKAYKCEEVWHRPM